MISDNHHAQSYDARKERIVDINVDEFVTAKKLATVCRKAPSHIAEWTYVQESQEEYHQYSA